MLARTRENICGRTPGRPKRQRPKVINAREVKGAGATDENQQQSCGDDSREHHNQTTEDPEAIHHEESISRKPFVVYQLPKRVNE
jgi:hypothetical protein